MAENIQIDRHIERWWLWFAVALFSLLPLDLLTTLVAVSKHGVAAEANPVMRFLLDQGLVAVVVAHLVVAGLAVSLFHAAMGQFRRSTPSHRRLVVPVVTVWIAVLNVAGIVVVSNNIVRLL